MRCESTGTKLCLLFHFFGSTNRTVHSWGGDEAARGSAAAQAVLCSGLLRKEHANILAGKKLELPIKAGD